MDVKEDGTSASDTKPLVTKGEVVDKITTGEDGKGESNKSLYIGKYIVEEIKEHGIILKEIRFMKQSCIMV